MIFKATLFGKVLYLVSCEHSNAAVIVRVTGVRLIRNSLFIELNDMLTELGEILVGLVVLIVDHNIPVSGVSAVFQHLYCLYLVSSAVA